MFPSATPFARASHSNINIFASHFHFWFNAKTVNAVTPSLISVEGLDSSFFLLSPLQPSLGLQTTVVRPSSTVTEPPTQSPTLLSPNRHPTVT